ncbi:hypothetical protein PoB_006002700 [Plakobranchus ocellatus]|uniref:Uncharacterized protein n=1 Tax=Plakobranchus ocellatus TaxID=259542 RepID=A0AAV4CNT9_9GAST|nr:hypothetical protein PoB_006002700 [Plakobranchus ocellatus]
MASITSTEESFQYHGEPATQHHHQHHHHQQQQQHDFADHHDDSPANSSKMTANLLDSCLPRQDDLRLSSLPSGQDAVAGLELATEGFLPISGRTREPLCHRRPRCPW